MPISESIPANEVEEEVVLINETPTMRNKELDLNEIRNNIWIVESGASSHIIKNARRLIKTRKSTQK